MSLLRIRTMARTLRLVVALGLWLQVLMAACTQAPGTSQDAGNPSRPLTATILPLETVLATDGEISVRVTIRNDGEQPEVWGRGSSHCRLALRVLVDGEFLEPGPPRMCTMDYVEHRLEPGEEYSETLQWDGTVLRDGRPEALPPGEYELYGLGGETRSEAAFIRLQSEG